MWVCVEKMRIYINRIMPLYVLPNWIPASAGMIGEGDGGCLVLCGLFRGGCLGHPWQHPKIEYPNGL